ncbi:unnamed protein product [Adineta steineri]|uniref:G-protein coupled receptors family 1 profile domain-containing protein n=1 Tax=Adineta steineri TaxID=433720 RepID=A0A819BYH6_9BILA|nr:unnamed protein product [Adineta steineri]CAF3811646.1 unnamed protein product [Adineta steineri]
MANANQTVYLIFGNINLTTELNNTSLLSNEAVFINYENLPLVERLTLYITFIVSVIGIIGNAGTIVVLNQQAMRKWRSSILLSALAAVDFLYLLIIFLSIIDTLTHQTIGLHRSLLLCQGTVYITHVCSFLSAAFTLSFTLQRFIAVLFPLHANTIISNRSSIINILLLIFISCSFYSFSFFLTNISQGQCREDETYPALFPLLIVDICLTFILPFIFILLCNIAIVYKLQSRKKFTDKFGGSLTIASYHRQTTDLCPERQRLYQSNGYVTNNDYIQLKNERKIATRKISTPCIESVRSGNEYLSRITHPRLSTPTLSYEHVTTTTGNGTHQRQTISQRTTKMLVICSTTFLIFNSPYCAVLFYSVISKHVLTRTLDILRHFYFMSFCLNFFLYSLCGNRFRHELIILLKASCRRCCLRSLRLHWLHFDKIPQQSSISRVTVRTGV